MHETQGHRHYDVIYIYIYIYEMNKIDKTNRNIFLCCLFFLLFLTHFDHSSSSGEKIFLKKVSFFRKF